MRHRKVSKRLARPAGHRRAILRNLAIALVKHQKIKTTKTKAKLTQSFTERLISLARKDSLHARRSVFRLLNDKSATSELFSRIAPLFKERTSGFTRITRLPFARAGDGAEMVFLELTEKSEKIKSESSKKENITKEQAQTNKKETKHTLMSVEKREAAKKNRHNIKEKPQKFLGSLRGLFKKGRDSL